MFDMRIVFLRTL